MAADGPPPSPQQSVPLAPLRPARAEPNTRPPHRSRRCAARAAFGAHAWRVAARALDALQLLHGPLSRAQPPQVQQLYGQQPPARSTQHADQQQLWCGPESAAPAAGGVSPWTVWPCPPSAGPTQIHDTSRAHVPAAALGGEKRPHTGVIVQPQHQFSKLIMTDRARATVLRAARRFCRDASRASTGGGGDTNHTKNTRASSRGQAGAAHRPPAGGEAAAVAAAAHAAAGVAPDARPAAEEHYDAGGRRQKGIFTHNVGLTADEREAYHAAMPFLRPSPYAGGRTSQMQRIRAADVALPDEPGAVHLLRVLPPAVASDYAGPSAATLRPEKEVAERAAAARKSGKRRVRPVAACDEREYVALLKRMYEKRMLTWMGQQPPVVNGLFAVAKDGVEQRLIIDARPANERFVDCPAVALPTPDLTAKLELDLTRAEPLVVAKVDLSNFYHQLRLPSWMTPYFALPPVRAGDVGQETISGGNKDALVWPCCATLPMGFSHAVYLAQRVHEHAAHQHCQFNSADAITAENDTRTDRTRHQLYIDDLILYGHNAAEVAQRQQHYIKTMRALGFPIRDKKVVLPSAGGVEALGMVVNGRQRTVGVAAHKLLLMVEATEEILAAGICSGDRMSEIIGSWTWAALARRPALAAFCAVYRYINTAGPIQFTLWPSVRRELSTICGLAPLLFSRLSPTAVGRIVASDASMTGMGVVAAEPRPGTQTVLAGELRPLAAAVQQRRTTAEEATAVAADALGRAIGSRGSDPERRRPATTRWAVWSTHRWGWREHINVLEARALACAVRNLCRGAGGTGSRALVLSDSAVVTAAVNKGRSSAYRLLVQLRRVQAHVLAYGLVLDVVWIPSGANPADGPSRDPGGMPVQQNEEPLYA
jgi:hypothetical protein